MSKEGKVVGKIVGDVLTIPYSGFGGSIVCNPNKTTTIIGKWIEPSGAGTNVVIDSKLFKMGENQGGINVLSFDGAGMTKAEQWAVNSRWLNEAASRNDVIHVISNPSIDSNIWINGIVGGEKSFFGLEVDLLKNLGYTFDTATFTFKK